MKNAFDIELALQNNEFYFSTLKAFRVDDKEEESQEAEVREVPEAAVPGPGQLPEDRPHPVEAEDDTEQGISGLKVFRFFSIFFDL